MNLSMKNVLEENMDFFDEDFCSDLFKILSSSYYSQNISIIISSEFFQVPVIFDSVLYVN